MKILGLPGVKIETKEWMQSLFSALGANSFESKIHLYRHWSDNVEADIDYEASCLENLSVDLVIAKSFGTLITTHTFASFNFKPKTAVLIGSPLKRHGLDNFGLLKRFVESVPTLFIQQTSDFNGSYGELKEVVQTYPNGSIVEVPGNDHIYSNIEELQKIIRPIYSADARRHVGNPIDLN